MNVSERRLVYHNPLLLLQRPRYSDYLRKITYALTYAFSSHCRDYRRRPRTFPRDGLGEKEKILRGRESAALGRPRRKSDSKHPKDAAETGDGFWLVGRGKEGKGVEEEEEDEEIMRHEGKRQLITISNEEQEDKIDRRKR